MQQQEFHVDIPPEQKAGEWRQGELSQFKNSLATSKYSTPQMAKEVPRSSADRLIEESKMPLKHKGADT